MEKTSVQFPKDCLEQMDQLANVRGSTRAQVVRQAVLEHLKKAKKEGEI